jgi:general nucleoside transport system permease protein
MELLAAILEAAVRSATPLALAALGELLIERSGIINIGLEGSVLAGAFAAAVVGAALGPNAGLLGGALSGAAIGAVFAVFVVTLRADQIVTGTAITLLALGLTGALARALFGDQGLAWSLGTLEPWPLPLLSQVPVVGRALFAQPSVTYAAVLAVILAHVWFTGTHAGLALRAVGEAPDAAHTAGIHVARMRWVAILVGCALAGISGAVLVVAQAGTFVEGMSAGRGFIAIAVVALARWRPLRLLGAALFFGAASALQFAAQALGWPLPYQVFLAVPYLAALLVLGISVRGQQPPAALGRHFAKAS